MKKVKTYREGRARVEIYKKRKRYLISISDLLTIQPSDINDYQLALLFAEDYLIRMKVLKRY